MKSKKSETKDENILDQPFQSNTQTNYYTSFEDLNTPTSQNIEINSNEPLIKDEESPELKTTFKENNLKEKYIFIVAIYVVDILFFSWTIINIHLKESSETDRISTGINFNVIILIIPYLIGLALMVAGVIKFLLKEKKLIECFSLILFGLNCSS